MPIALSIKTGKDNKCIVHIKPTVLRSPEVRAFLITHQWNDRMQIFSFNALLTSCWK